LYGTDIVRGTNPSPIGDYAGAGFVFLPEPQQRGSLRPTLPKVGDGMGAPVASAKRHELNARIHSASSKTPRNTPWGRTFGPFQKPPNFADLGVEWQSRLAATDRDLA
jgi:hypothetical protein